MSFIERRLVKDTDIDQPFTNNKAIEKSEPRLILTDTASGGAERRYASSAGHAKIKDSTDADVMDLEAHASRHAYGGADALGAGAVDRSQIKPLGYHFVKSASPTPGVSGAYGTAVVIAAQTNKSIVLLSAALTWGGTFGSGETVTIRLTAKFSDNTTANITKSATTTGSQALNSADLQGLMKDGVYITEVDVDSSSDAASTSVTTSATIYGLSI